MPPPAVPCAAAVAGMAEPLAVWWLLALLRGAVEEEAENSRSRSGSRLRRAASLPAVPAAAAAVCCCGPAPLWKEAGEEAEAEAEVAAACLWDSLELRKPSQPFTTLPYAAVSSM